MSLITGVVKRSASGSPRSIPLSHSGIFDHDLAQQYAKFVAAEPLTHLPPMAFHNLCFPSTARVLGEPAVPARLPGLVHESLTWEILEPLPVGVPATASSLITRTKRRRGVAIEVTSVVHAGDVRHYVERAVYFARRPLRGKDYDFVHPDAALWEGPAIPDLRTQFGLNDVGALDIGQRAAIALRKFEAHAGRRWAKISGDVNPIHMSALAARPFGFKTAIAHGAAIDAWVHACLGVDGSEPASGATKFRAPTRIPNEIELVPFGEGLYGVIERRSGRDLVHVWLEGETQKERAQSNPNRIVIPRVNGRASSTALGRSAFAAAAGTDGQIRELVETTRNWRKSYREPVREVSVIDDPMRGGEAARRGLDYLESQVTTAGGLPIGQIVAATDAPDGERITGSGKRRESLSIPYRGRQLEGDALRNQIQEWAANGTMTAIAAQRLHKVADTPQWLDLTDTTIGVLGAGAELAPTRFLLEYGATVAAVIRPQSARYAALVSDAENLAGTLELSPELASDIVSETGAVAGWMIDRKPHAVVETLYSPGVDFVLLELGADAIMRNVAETTNAMLAWYGTPTDAYPIGANRERAGGVAQGERQRKPLAAMRGTPAIRDGIYNGIVDYQGPNYILAKRIGRWRASALAAAGKKVSYNVAPMAATESVFISKTLKAAYRGMEKLGIESFEADTAAAIMATLLVWDLRNPHTANADFLTEAGVPSGLWSQNFEAQDILKRAVLLGSGAYLRMYDK
ncbi:acyl dehydratase [Trueperella bonasi]|uniref:Acyl dehydratase n=1 Tax=Trueperella bonasi TaxID=312286 RepID=A0ABT9NHK1_9ACTO|nr:MaoC/PaaZ C-terminal domain-containing protein [Trueperella bonasi]MDP9806885.1 acyl dehydratase [Trueperella bonasi]